MRRFLCFLIILIAAKFSFSQNEANIWYFGNYCGLDFNSGVPVVLHDGQTVANLGVATISDSLGNLLFYTGHHNVYNKNHDIMVNGTDFVSPGIYGRAIVKWPGKDGLYYIFTAEHPSVYTGFYYSIVDLKLENGLGAVTQKEIAVESAMDAADRVAIVKQENSENVWVIVRKFTDDAFAAYLVDENGFNSNPVLSEMPDIFIDVGEWGYLKISYDKRYLVSSYMNHSELEICSFNASNGLIDYMYTLEDPGGVGETLAGIEFSPDSKYLYVGFNISVDTNKIYQFDMQYIADGIMFSNSGIWVGTGGSRALQLARDGKIYCTITDEPSPYYYLNVIHNPWIRGEGCMYEKNAITMYPGEVEWSLPNILLDYLLRFEWKGDQCQGSPIHFIPNFIPPIDSIKWVFEAFSPGSYSEEFSPVYAFQTPGIHEVQVDVWYSSGQYEHTSREIEIFPVPHPDLGPDTLICEGNSVTLFANCTADLYSWSTSQFGSPEITVTDSGTYWVKASFNETGCKGYDTIHVGFYPPILIDESGLVVTPTSCGGATGSITGLSVLGSMPLIFQWKDLSGNGFGSAIDVFNLPAGQYTLSITDVNECQTTSAVYTIEDAGNLQVLDVQLTQPHCGRPDGQIVVHAFSPSGSALEYSIDDGVTYQADSVFYGLIDTSYVVRVTDENGCEGFYTANPVILQDILGPQVQQVNITNETDFLGNGSIEIIASGSTPIIYYSIDGGNTWQLNDGNFYNLQSGIYSLQVKDENDCDTAFIVEIQNIILTYLQAITGPGEHCLGDAVTIPIEVENFNSVATFRLQLSYNADNLQCEGFANVHPQLADSLTGWVDQAAGDIHLAWNSPTSVTFPATEKVADLVFTTKNPGQGELAWYTGATESYFTNAGGMPIPAEFSTGEVIIYEPPEILLSTSKTVCEGQMFSIMSIASGNQPPISYRWTYPSGDTSGTDPFIFNVTSSDAGFYTLLATDIVGCTDQKSIELIVSENPVAAFHGSDTLEMHEGEFLDAGTGLSSYLWNTGDTTASIIINAEGMYSVEMTSSTGCIGTDAVYIKVVSEEIPELEIYVPNAFSPNGDGINDSFQIIFPNSTFNIQNSTLSIFDRWGGEVFSSKGIENGWDGKKAGKDCPGGVYVYKIVFSVDGVPGSQERVGVVMVVR